MDKGYSKIYLEPFPKPNPQALSEIMNADLVVLGPGGLHTSIIPNLLVEGVGEALTKTQAKKVFICNLMNRKGQTTGYKVSDYLNEIVRYLGKDIFDHILVNNQIPDQALIEKYAEEGDLVKNDLSDSRVISANLLGELTEVKTGDIMKRSLIRHNSKQVTKEIINIVDHL
ncbi:MAG: YvcK family protein [Simkaniaceae bacterium]|nr:YvcK family protein [Simkaniaceae bacterium]